MKLLRWCCFIGFFLCSCSYQFGNRYGLLPGGYTNTFFEFFTNKTAFPGVEIEFMNALKEEMTRSKKIQVLEDQNQSQTFIQGVIERVEIIPGTQLKSLKNLPSGSVLTSSYRLFLTITVELHSRSERKKIWDYTVQGETVYSAPQVLSEVVNSLNSTYNESAIKKKLSELAVQMMKDVHDHLLERF